MRRRACILHAAGGPRDVAAGRGLSETFWRWGRELVDEAEVPLWWGRWNQCRAKWKEHLLFRSSVLFQALNRCQLKHTISLWQFLSAHKSEHLLRLRKVSLASSCPPGRKEPHAPFPGFRVSCVLISFQEPFGEISPRYKVDLSPENAKLLNTFLNQIGLDAFLLELHEMMVLKLKNPKTAENFNPEWRYRLVSLLSEAHTQHSAASPEIFHRCENHSYVTAEIGFLLMYHYQLQKSHIFSL